MKFPLPQSVKRFIKKVAKYAIRKTVIPACQFVVDNLNLAKFAPVHIKEIVTNAGTTFNEMSVNDHIHFIARRELAQFVYDHCGQAYFCNSYQQTLRHCIDIIPTDGLICEFGVFEGWAINEIAKSLVVKQDSRCVYGFDIFTGLTKEWSGQSKCSPNGLLGADGILPKVETSVTLFNGNILDNLTKFLEANKKQSIVFIHLNIDNYSLSKSILEMTRSFVSTGTIILIDEFISHRGYLGGSYKALTEIYNEMEYEFVVINTQKGFEAAVQIK